MVLWYLIKESIGHENSFYIFRLKKLRTQIFPRGGILGFLNAIIAVYGRALVSPLVESQPSDRSLVLAEGV